MRGKLPVLAAGVAAGLFGAGFLAGRVTGEEPERVTHAAPVQMVAAAPIVVAPVSLVPHEHHEHASSVLAAALAPIEGRAELAPGDETDARILRLLDAAQASLRAPTDDHACEAAEKAAAELELALGADPAALARAIEAFRGLRDVADLEALAAVLGRFADPEVEQAALEVAARDVSPARRAAAFDVLDAIDTGAARDLALQALASERDVDVRRAALRALPEPAGSSLEDAAAVVTTLARLTQDPDPEVRRRAAVSLGTWHRTDAELAPIVAMLSRDPSPEARTGAAFGLELARRRTPETLGALVASLTRPDEDPAVRDCCWRALSALSPLPADAHAAWEQYRREAEVLSEDEPG